MGNIADEIKVDLQRLVDLKYGAGEFIVYVNPAHLETVEIRIVHALSRKRLAVNYNVAIERQIGKLSGISGRSEVLNWLVEELSSCYKITSE